MPGAWRRRWNECRKPAMSLSDFEQSTCWRRKHAVNNREPPAGHAVRGQGLHGPARSCRGGWADRWVEELTAARGSTVAASRRRLGSPSIRSLQQCRRGFRFFGASVHTRAAERVVAEMSASTAAAGATAAGYSPNIDLQTCTVLERPKSLAHQHVPQRPEWLAQAPRAEMSDHGAPLGLAGMSLRTCRRGSIGIRTRCACAARQWSIPSAR